MEKIEIKMKKNWNRIKLIEFFLKNRLEFFKNVIEVSRVLQYRKKKKTIIRAYTIFDFPISRKNRDFH